MAADEQDFPALVKEIRRQLALSQEDFARELGVSFATINRWENDKTKPSKLGKAQFDRFYAQMVQQGKLKAFKRNVTYAKSIGSCPIRSIFGPFKKVIWVSA